VVRDGQGERLTGRATASDGGSLKLEYKTPVRPRHLFFQLLPQGAGPERRHLVLAVRSTALARERLLTLTSGGNAEVVSLHWDGQSPTESDCGPAALDAEAGRLQTLRALLRLDGSAARLDVVIPVALVETWLPLPRRERDWLATAEQEAVRERLAALVRGRSILHAEGRTSEPTSATVTFLALDDASLDAPAPARRVSTWTGRVRISLTFPAGIPVELEWDLFNAAVLTADVFVLAGNECTRHRLSTYAPRLSVPPERLRARIRNSGRG
jgi:hypothetical protein